MNVSMNECVNVHRYVERRSMRALVCLFFVNCVSTNIMCVYKCVNAMKFERLMLSAFVCESYTNLRVCIDVVIMPAYTRIRKNARIPRHTQVFVYTK